MNRKLQLRVNLNASFLKHNLRVTMKLTDEENQSHCLEKPLRKKDIKGLQVLEGDPLKGSEITMNKVSCT